MEGLKEQPRNRVAVGVGGGEFCRAVGEAALPCL